jgi:hypothetical protein
MLRVSEIPGMLEKLDPGRVFRYTTYDTKECTVWFERSFGGGLYAEGKSKKYVIATVAVIRFSVPGERMDAVSAGITRELMDRGMDYTCQVSFDEDTAMLVHDFEIAGVLMDGDL